MYNKENHLTKVRDFNLVLKQGCWVNNLFLSLKVLDLAKNESYFPSTGDVDKFKKQLKLAIVVGLKVSKSAVERNRLKRQMREVVRLMIQDKHLPEGYYLMLVGQKEMLGKNYAEISGEVKVLIERILINKNSKY